MSLDPKNLQVLSYHGGYVGVMNGLIIGEDGIVEGSQNYKVDSSYFIEIHWTGERWAVSYGGTVLNKETLDFEYNPSPSNRADDFVEKTRFDTLEEACACIDAYRKAKIASWREHLKNNPELERDAFYLKGKS